VSTLQESTRSVLHIQNPHGIFIGNDGRDKILNGWFYDFFKLWTTHRFHPDNHPDAIGSMATSVAVKGVILACTIAASISPLALIIAFNRLPLMQIANLQPV